MARRRREQLRAEWIDRLRRFQKRSGNVEEFCRAEGVSLAMLYRWRQQLAGKRHPPPLLTARVP